MFKKLSEKELKEIKGGKDIIYIDPGKDDCKDKKSEKTSAVPYLDLFKASLPFREGAPHL